MGENLKIQRETIVAKIHACLKETVKVCSWQVRVYRKKIPPVKKGSYSSGI